MSTTTTNSLWFPRLYREHILACQTSAWYPLFERKTIKCTIIPALSDDFKAYLESDGIIIPEGAEDRGPSIEMSDDEAQESDSDDDPPQRYAFPELDAQIRQAISTYDAVFPKLNWTAPKDAAWMLSTNAPLKCTSPADVYLLLKSSDFAMHDLDEAGIFEGCVDQALPSNGLNGEHGIGDDADMSSVSSAELHENSVGYNLELVLKKWYEVERSREVRCFIRDNRLLAISQRDPNFFEHLVPLETQNRIRATVWSFWRREVKNKFANGRVPNYVLDLLLTRDLSRAHIVDFNPYAPRTDSLLFEWSELAELHEQALSSEERLGLQSLSLEESAADEQLVSEATLPPLRIVTSPNQATRPAYSHNMVPAEALSDNAMQFAAQMAVEMAQRAREAQELEARRNG
ncbi:cell division cycle protein [Ceratobasidium sp. AG-Ba]|nr:cell division cycle protein [Ceratobasidium sp. AG-Ba]